MVDCHNNRSVWRLVLSQFIYNSIIIWNDTNFLLKSVSRHEQNMKDAVNSTLTK